MTWNYWSGVIHRYQICKHDCGCNVQQPVCVNIKNNTAHLDIEVGHLW